MGSDNSKGASKERDSSASKEPERKSTIDNIGPGKPFHRPACCTRAGSVKYSSEDKPIAKPTDKKKLDYDELPAHQPRMSLQCADRLNTLIKTEDPNKPDVKTTTGNDVSKAGTLPCSTRIAVVSTDPRRHTATIDSVTISSDYALPQDAMPSDSDTDIEVFDNVNENIQWTQSPSFEPTESAVTPPSTPSTKTDMGDNLPVTTTNAPAVLRVAEQNVIESEEVESIVERDEEHTPMNIDDSLEQLKTIAEGLDSDSNQLKIPVESVPVETFEEGEAQFIKAQEEALPFKDTFRELHVSVSNEDNGIQTHDEYAHNPEDLKIDFERSELEARPHNRDVTKLATDRVFGAHLSPGGTPYFFQALIDEAQPQQKAVTSKDGKKGKIKSKRRSRSKRSERCSRQNLSVDNQFDPYSFPTLSNEYRNATNDVSPTDTSIAREYCAAVAIGVARPDNISTPTLSREVVRATETLAADTNNIDKEETLPKCASEISNVHATLSKEYKYASGDIKSEPNANINEEVLTAAVLSQCEDLDPSPATLQRICANNIERTVAQSKTQDKTRFKELTRSTDGPGIKPNNYNSDTLKAMAERALREYKSQYVYVGNVSSPKLRRSNSGKKAQDTAPSEKPKEKGIYDKLLDPKGSLQERIDSALRDISRAVFNLSPANTLEKTTCVTPKRSQSVREITHTNTQEEPKTESTNYTYNPIFSQETKQEHVSDITSENNFAAKLSSPQYYEPNVHISEITQQNHSSPKLELSQRHEMSVPVSNSSRNQNARNIKLQPLETAKPKTGLFIKKEIESARKPQPSKHSFQNRMKEWEYNNSDLKDVVQVDPEFEAAYLWNASEDIIKKKCNSNLLETPSNTPDVITGNIWTSAQSKRVEQSTSQHVPLKRTNNVNQQVVPMPHDQVYDLLMAAKSRVEAGDLTRSTEFVYPPESDDNDDDGIVEFSITKTYTEPTPFDNVPRNKSPPEKTEQGYNFVNPLQQTRDVSSHRLKRNPSSGLIPLAEEDDILDDSHKDVFFRNDIMSKSSGDIAVNEYVSQWLKNQPKEMETPPQYFHPSELNESPNNVTVNRISHSKSDSVLSSQNLPSNNGELQEARDQMDGLKVQLKMLHEQMRSMGDILDTTDQNRKHSTVHETSDKGC